MQFYNGFSLRNEHYLFDAYIKKSAYTVCGFSYGAMKAFEYTLAQLASAKRIDTLELFSPAFFQMKDAKFKKLQVQSYKKNEEAYLRQFIDACFFPHDKKIIERAKSNIHELEELLFYEWDLQALQALVDKGVKIEVYLGSEDKIIDVEEAREFFLKVATVTYIKNANHFLQTS